MAHKAVASEGTYSLASLSENSCYFPTTLDYIDYIIILFIIIMALRTSATILPPSRGNEQMRPFKYDPKDTRYECVLKQPQRHKAIMKGEGLEVEGKNGRL